MHIMIRMYQRTANEVWFCVGVVAGVAFVI